MSKIYSINDEYVTPEQYADFISDLLAKGWTLEPPEEE